MTKKEREELMKDYEDLACFRIDRLNAELREIEEYNEKYEIFSTMYENLISEYPNAEIEQFRDVMLDLCNMEDTYIFMQGFLDGINVDKIYNRNKFKKRQNKKRHNT